MTKAFCPGHITCFFSPVITGDPLTTGSLGAGIRLDKGATVTLEERRDKKIIATADGKECAAAIAKDAVRHLMPDRGFDILIGNDLPVSQGLGMSAASAVASALCVAAMFGMDDHDAYVAAHIAEVRNGGGLGDVSGIMGGRQTVRVSAGIPPYGRTIDTGLRMRLTVAVLSGGVDTKDVLSDDAAIERIKRAGAECVNEYIARPHEKRLYGISAKFMNAAGLGTERVREALSALAAYPASMCMLGNSIFTNASAPEVKDALGAGVTAFPCRSGGGPKVIRKA